MRILLVYAHPAKNSFNRAILDSLMAELKLAGHDLKLKDLYAEKFDPVLSEDDLVALHSGEVPARIQKEQAALSWAEGLVFIYPLWWYATPAILKGWFDCTFTHGYAFRQQSDQLQGLLTHRQALIIITAGSKQTWFESKNAVDILYRPISEGTLAFCGINHIKHKIIYDITSKKEKELNNILNDIKNDAQLFEYKNDSNSAIEHNDLSQQPST